MFLLRQFIIVSPLKKVKGKLNNARRGILAIIRSYLILDTYIYIANKYLPFKKPEYWCCNKVKAIWCAQ